MINVVNLQTKEMAILTVHPFTMFVPRGMGFREKVVRGLKDRGHSVCEEKKREFLYVSRQMVIPAIEISEALIEAGISEVHHLANVI